MPDIHIIIDVITMMIQSIITQKFRKDSNGNLVFVIPASESKKYDIDKYYTITVMGPFSEIESNGKKRIIAKI